MPIKPSEPVNLTAGTVAKLRELYDRQQFEISHVRRRQLHLDSRGDDVEFEIAKTDGSGVPARSGDVPGSGVVSIYTIRQNSATSTLDLTSAGYTETVLNLAGTAVGANKWVTIKLHQNSGQWLVDWEDC